MKFLLSKEKVLENWLNPFLTGATNQNIQGPANNAGNYDAIGISNPNYSQIPPVSDPTIDIPSWLKPEGNPEDGIQKMSGDILSVGRYYINGVPLTQWSAIGGSAVASQRGQQMNNYYYMDAIMKKTFPNGIKAYLNKDEITEYKISEVVIQKMKPTSTGIGLNLYLKFKFNEQELWGKYENVGVYATPTFICEQISGLKTEDQIKLTGKLRNIIFEWFKAKTGIYKCLAKEVLAVNEKGQYEKIIQGSIIEVLHSDKDSIKIKNNDTIFLLKKPNYYWFNWYFEKRK